MTGGKSTTSKLGVLLCGGMFLSLAAGCGDEQGNGATVTMPLPVPSPSAVAPLSNPALVLAGDTFANPDTLQEIFTVEIDGSGRTQVTRDGFNKFLPHFSRDGKRLLYTKYYRGGYGDRNPVVTDIVLLERAGGVETRLTNSGTAIQPAFSPDERRIVFGTLVGDGLWLIAADGSDLRRLGGPSGAADDRRWGDVLWSSDDWIYFTVAESVDGCLKVRIDRIRPDGSGRIKITDGGPDCTPPGFEQSGDADPGISPDGRTIYSSRGLPVSPPGYPAMTIRHLYRFSSDPWTPGKPEVDLSAAAKANCISGVPKVSPTGDRVALFLLCPDDPDRAGVTITDPAGSFYSFVTRGFGADWNPSAANGR